MAEWTGVSGKQVVITGATSGIGLAAADALAARGANLAIVARSPQRAEQVRERLASTADGTASIEILQADLSSQAAVRALASEICDRYPRVDLLVNNAGAMFATKQLTEDGLEMTWALNHLAPFLLTNLLWDRLTQSAPARVITTASDAHKGSTIPLDDPNAEHAYRSRGFARYGETKLANILFTVELARRLQGTGVTANCFHPGLVATGFNRNNGLLNSLAMMIVRPFSRGPQKGAETLVWLADSPELTEQTGGYFVDKRRVTPSHAAQDADSARRLWELSERQTGIDATSG